MKFIVIFDFEILIVFLGRRVLGGFRSLESLVCSIFSWFLEDAYIEGFIRINCVFEFGKNFILSYFRGIFGVLSR